MAPWKRPTVCLTMIIICLRLATIPNLVTLARPLLTAPFIWYAYHLPDKNGKTCTLSFVLCVLIMASDCLDGWLARRLGQTSHIGRLLDHLCDVTFILLALLTFARHGIIPWWLPAAIAWSFLMYVVDSWWRTTAKPFRALLPTRMGHWGGILYYVTVAIVLVDVCLVNVITQAVLSYGWLQLMALLAVLSGSERLYCLFVAPRQTSI